MKELLKPKSKWNIFWLKIFYGFFEWFNDKLWETGINSESGENMIINYIEPAPSGIYVLGHGTYDPSIKNK